MMRRWSTGEEPDERPWGSFTVLDDAEGHKVKRMVVRPGKRLSYQRHTRRSEHWFVVHGRGRAIVEGSARELTAGHGRRHPGAPPPTGSRTTDRTDLVFIEVQHGDYFGEDDIVRLEDDFGRAPLGS